MTRSPYPHTDRELLQRISRSAGGKAGYKQLIRELGLGGGRERRLLVEQLTRMVARGELRQPEDGLWAIPRPDPADTPQNGRTQTSSSDSRELRSGGRPQSGAFAGTRPGRDRLVSGKLELHRDGFGFVRLDSATVKGETPADIFIPPVALHGAMHGDLVLVEEDPSRGDGRRSGRIARVLTRRNPTLVGIFHYARRRGRNGRDGSAEPEGDFVQPLDDRLGGPVEISGDLNLPVPSTNANRTLGAETWQAQGATEAEADPRWPLEGLAVEVEITDYPRPGRPARGRVLEVLGPPDGFGVDVEIVIRKHAIPHTFPAHVLAEAEASSTRTVAALPPEEMARREDFRGLPIVTIDGETARDFDDAVLVRPLPNGNTELQVHIADVGWYVGAGSALDTEARVRGTSVYFPDRAVPMLPHALSSGMCSLLPHEDRLVLSCLMEVDGRGEIASYRVAEGMIRSARRMTYTSVQHCLQASPAAAGWNQRANQARPITPPATAEDALERERVGLEQPELPAAFDRMLELALRLNGKRVRRGSIDFDLPEPVVQFDPDGNMKAIVRSERGWSHRLIEEFMLSANECVATWLTAQGIPSLYRIHEMPSPKRVLDFEDTAAAFGQTLGVGALPVKRLTMKADRREARRQSARGRETRQPQAHEVPASLPVTPQMYQDLVRRIAGKPEERILAYLMLRSLKQARYAETNEGHFALASPCYTHFTSPIRRYPDLIIHRLLRAMLRGGADARGGPIHSGDPQPWAAELARAQGRPALDAAPARALRPHGDHRATAAAGMGSALAEPRPKRHPDRIGWSDEADGSLPAGRTAAVARGWDTEPDVADPESGDRTGEPMAAAELNDIAVESSQAERRAAEAERELIEWKKMKFMADKVGDDFAGIILSVTKFGFFVELDELFVEGLVPLGSLPGDFYSYRDADRAICGARSGHCFRAGDRVEVILDRIDHQQRRLQFALLPGTEPAAGPARQAGEPRPAKVAKKGRKGGKAKAALLEGSSAGKGRAPGGRTARPRQAGAKRKGKR